MTSRSKRRRKYHSVGLGGNTSTGKAEQFPELVGRSLHDAVYKLDSKKVIHVGTTIGRAFFFVGNRREFNRDIDRLGEIKHTDFRLRPVVDAYSKIFSDEGVILIIEGEEQGRCWDYEEYKAYRRMILGGL